MEGRLCLISKGFSLRGFASTEKLVCVGQSTWGLKEVLRVVVHLLRFNLLSRKELKK